MLVSRPKFFFFPCIRVVVKKGPFSGLLLLGGSEEFRIVVQGGSKKMSHSDFLLKSVLGVRFYFPICVLASEFRARFI